MWLLRDVEIELVRDCHTNMNSSHLHIEFNIDVGNVKNLLGPFLLAVQHDRLEILELLLQQERLSPNHRRVAQDEDFLGDNLTRSMLILDRKRINAARIARRIKAARRSVERAAAA